MLPASVSTLRGADLRVPLSFGLRLITYDTGRKATMLLEVAQLLTIEATPSNAGVWPVGSVNAPLSVGGRKAKDDLVRGLFVLRC